MKLKTELLMRGSRIPYRYFSNNGHEHYNVRLTLDASPAELKKVEKVVYKLHPDFYRPTRVSDDRARKFAVDIWTYGYFDMTAEVHLRNGDITNIQHKVQYDLPEDDGDRYVEI